MGNSMAYCRYNGESQGTPPALAASQVSSAQSNRCVGASYLRWPILNSCNSWVGGQYHDEGRGLIKNFVEQNHRPSKPRHEKSPINPHITSETTTVINWWCLLLWQWRDEAYLQFGEKENKFQDISTWNLSVASAEWELSLWCELWVSRVRN